MEVPDQTKAAETEPVQAPGGDLAVDRVNREEGDPEPGQNSLLGRLGVLEHERCRRGGRSGYSNGAGHESMNSSRQDPARGMVRSGTTGGSELEAAPRNPMNRGTTAGDAP